MGASDEGPNLYRDIWSGIDGSAALWRLMRRPLLVIAGRIVVGRQKRGHYVSFGRNCTRTKTVNWLSSKLKKTANGSQGATEEGLSGLQGFGDFDWRMKHCYSETGITESWSTLLPRNNENKCFVSRFMGEKWTNHK